MIPFKNISRDSIVAGHVSQTVGYYANTATLWCLFDKRSERSRYLPLLAGDIFAKSLPTRSWRGARSSAGEHYVDIVGVTGSIPVAPTISFKHLGDIWPWEEAQDGSLVSK